MTGAGSDRPEYRSFWRDGVIALFVHGSTTASIEEFSPAVRLCLRSLLFVLFLVVAIPIGVFAAYVWWLLTFSAPAENVWHWLVNAGFASFIASVAIAFLGKLLAMVLPQSWTIVERIEAIAESRFKVVVAFCLLLAASFLVLILAAVLLS